MVDFQKDLQDTKRTLTKKIWLGFENKYKYKVYSEKWRGAVSETANNHAGIPRVNIILQERTYQQSHSVMIGCISGYWMSAFPLDSRLPFKGTIELPKDLRAH